MFRKGKPFSAVIFSIYTRGTAKHQILAMSVISLVHTGGPDRNDWSEFCLQKNIKTRNRHWCTIVFTFNWIKMQCVQNRLCLTGWLTIFFSGSRASSLSALTRLKLDIRGLQTRQRRIVSFKMQLNKISTNICCFCPSQQSSGLT